MAQGVLYTDLRFAKGPGGRGTASQALEAGESHGILTPPPTANIITSLLPYLPPTALGMDEAESPHENITPELMPVGTAEERARHSPGKWLAGMGMWEITVWAVCIASGHSLFPPWREEVPTLCHHVATMLSGDAQEVTEGDVWPLGVLQGAGPTGAVSLWGCWLSVCCCWWLLWCWGPAVSRDMWHWDMGTERGEVGLGATDYAREHGSRSVCPSCPKLQLVPRTSWLCPLAAVTHTPHLVLLSCSPALILPQPALLLPQPPLPGPAQLHLHTSKSSPSIPSQWGRPLLCLSHVQPHCLSPWLPHPHVPSHPALSPDWQVTRQLQDTSREQVAERGRFSQEVRVRDQSLEQMQKELAQVREELQQAWQEGNNSQQELGRWEAELAHVSRTLAATQKELSSVQGRLNASESTVTLLRSCTAIGMAIGRSCMPVVLRCGWWLFGHGMEMG